MELSSEQIERYARQIILPEIGSHGQEKLLGSRVLVIGAGGLGSPACIYLAAAGIGTIGIADGDLVELSNLQRQIVHSTEDVGRPKTASAAAKLHAINPDVVLRTHAERLIADNAAGILTDYDFVIECTDNLPSKFLIADGCRLVGKAYSYAGVLRFEGQTMTIIPGCTCCYRCIFDKPPSDEEPACSEAGIIGPVAGVMGMIQATEAIKYLLGIGDLLTNRLLMYDALRMTFRIVALRRNLKCPLCGSCEA